MERGSSNRLLLPLKHIQKHHTNIEPKGRIDDDQLTYQYITRAIICEDEPI